MAKERKDRLEEVQKEAYLAWIKAGYRGTINVATGVGKTFIAFKCLYKALKAGKVTGRPKVIFYAETDVRKMTLDEEAAKFNTIYGLDINKDFEMSFVCYQAAKELDADIKILDEIHFIGEKLAKQFEKEKALIIGLTATTSESTIVNEQTGLTKEDIINQIAPVCFRYTLEQGIDEGILSPYVTTLVPHELDNTERYLKPNQRSKILVTEKAYYDTKNIVKNLPSTNEFMRKTLGRQMAKLLWQCRSKAETVKNLLTKLEGKTIIFGVELDLLHEITENVVSGRQSEEENTKLIESFNCGDISIIASSKKLKQGITLEGVTNCILVSYYGTSTDFIQKLGRIVRFVPNKVANLYILVTKGTFEETWMQKMTIVRDSKGRVLYDVELNVM